MHITTIRAKIAYAFMRLDKKLNITNISRHADISYATAQANLKDMVDQKLCSNEFIGRDQIYVLTERGKQYCSAIAEAYEVINNEANKSTQ